VYRRGVKGAAFDGVVLSLLFGEAGSRNRVSRAASSSRLPTIFALIEGGVLPWEGNWANNYACGHCTAGKEIIDLAPGSSLQADQCTGGSGN
jgi:hypothetical protein